MLNFLFLVFSYSIKVLLAYLDMTVDQVCCERNANKSKTTATNIIHVIARRYFIKSTSSTGSMHMLRFIKAIEHTNEMSVV